MSNYLLKKFKKDLLKNSEVIDNFLNLNLSIGDKLNRRLLKAMRYSLLGSGKKIRSFLLVETGKMISNLNNVNSTNEIYNQLIILASAIEAIHTYSLIHDDLPAIDNSDFRRGKESSHIKFGEATAILAGDALQCWAFELVSSPDNINDPLKISKIVFLLSRALGYNGMVGGQQGDIDFVSEELSEDDILWVQQKKTGKLIECCVLLATIIAQATEKQILNLKNYAYYLGIAFQIKDDLLDINSNSKILGKPIKQDKFNNSPNFVNLYGEINSKKKLREFNEKAIESLNIFGNYANNLVLLAKYITNRDF